MYLNASCGFQILKIDDEHNHDIKKRSHTVQKVLYFIVRK